MNPPSSSTLVEFHCESLITVEEYSLETKVCVGLMAPVLVLLILFMNGGIAYYEKFGNDPQKRNLYNMMLSSLCMSLTTIASLSVVFASIRIICGSFDVSNAFAFIFMLLSFQYFSALCLLESIIYRMLAAFCPKTIIGINDDWYHCFLNYSNLMMALIASSSSTWNVTPWTPLQNYGYPVGYYTSLLIAQDQFLDNEM